MIVVIGASGFIGTYLVDDLVRSGRDVFATGRNEKALSYYESAGVRCCSLDISKKEDFDRLPQKDVEAVVLLSALLPANVTDENPYEYIDVNITGTVNVLEYCRRNGIKKVISTTSYADVRNKWSADYAIPSDTLRDYDLADDHSLYIVSKNAASDIMIYYNNRYGMECSIFRLPPVYGVGPHSGLFVNGEWRKSGFQIFLEKAEKGEPICIYGDKDTIRDIVYVRDVTGAIVQAIDSDDVKGMYNITSGESSSLEDQVRDIIEVFGGTKKSEVTNDRGKNNSSRSYRFDISKARNDFGYSPRYVPFRKLVEEYKKELSNPSIAHLDNQYHKK